MPLGKEFDEKAPQINLKLTDVRPEKNQPLEAVTAMLRPRMARERRDARVAKFTEEGAAGVHLQPVPGFLPVPPSTR